MSVILTQQSIFNWGSGSFQISSIDIGWFRFPTGHHNPWDLLMGSGHLCHSNLTRGREVSLMYVSANFLHSWHESIKQSWDRLGIGDLDGIQGIFMLQKIFNKSRELRIDPPNHNVAQSYHNTSQSPSQPSSPLVDQICFALVQPERLRTSRRPVPVARLLWTYKFAAHSMAPAGWRPRAHEICSWGTTLLLPLIIIEIISYNGTLGKKTSSLKKTNVFLSVTIHFPPSTKTDGKRLSIGIYRVLLNIIDYCN